MALTPEGTPYVESTDLVANYPAASLSLANRVDLVGVLPFADAAARTAAITSPTDGQFTYLQDTNTPEFYNGSAYVPVGVAPGLILVAPSSIANTGGSASATGGAVTFTGVTSVSLNGVFTSTYENYLILGDFDGTTGTPVTLRLRLAGSDAATNYDYQHLLVGSSTVSGSRSTSQTAFRFAIADAVTIFNLWKPQLAASTYLFSNSMQAGPEINTYAGLHTTATGYDGFSVISSAAITGTVRVYGYKNS